MHLDNIHVIFDIHRSVYVCISMQLYKRMIKSTVADLSAACAKQTRLNGTEVKHYRIIIIYSLSAFPLAPALLDPSDV